MCRRFWARDLDGLSSAPEALQVVIRAGALQEDVHQQIAVIHQDPFTVTETFHADRQFAEFALHSDVNFVGDGLVLTGIGSGADHKEISEARDFTKIENLYVQSFLVLSGADGSEPARRINCDRVLVSLGQSGFLLPNTTSLLSTNVLQLK